MRKTVAVFALALALLASPPPAAAQGAEKVYRIGFLHSGYFTPNVAAFAENMRALGYADYRNFVIESRYAGGYRDLLQDMAADLVHLKMDLIFADSTPAALAAKNATMTIPIVMMAGDPVRSGLVASLARPGGNITGLAFLAPELTAKRLELLKEVAPKATRAAVIWDVSESGGVPDLKETRAAARALGIELVPLEVRAWYEWSSAFAAIIKEKAHALIVDHPSDPLAYPPAGRILEFAAERRMPAIYSWGSFADAGGLMSYGPSFGDLMRRAAAQVDKILKGAKPADLPVEQPRKFELVINLKAAKVLGITIPPEVLFRATRVIK